MEWKALGSIEFIQTLNVVKMLVFCLIWHKLYSLACFRTSFKILYENQLIILKNMPLNLSHRLADNQYYLTMWVFDRNLRRYKSLKHLILSIIHRMRRHQSIRSEPSQNQRHHFDPILFHPLLLCIKQCHGYQLKQVHQLMYNSKDHHQKQINIFEGMFFYKFS